MKWLTETPTSEAQAFDMLVEMFGLGDWDEGDGLPYFKFRMLEISKLKATMKKRGANLDDVVVAARYCYRRKVPIVAVWQLFDQLAAARRELRETKKADALVELDKQLDFAVAYERRLADDMSVSWINRLLRAQGNYREEVFQEWRKARSLPV